ENREMQEDLSAALAAIPTRQARLEYLRTHGPAGPIATVTVDNPAYFTEEEHQQAMQVADNRMESAVLIYTRARNPNPHPVQRLTPNADGTTDV
ncbi:MAG: hypothetical protein ACRC9R_12130, partial [Enterovibrio sp.]